MIYQVSAKELSKTLDAGVSKVQRAAPGDFQRAWMEGRPLFPAGHEMIGCRRLIRKKARQERKREMSYITRRKMGNRVIGETCVIMAG